MLKRGDGGQAGQGERHAFVDPIILKIMLGNRLCADRNIDTRLAQLLDKRKVRVRDTELGAILRIVEDERCRLAIGHCHEFQILERHARCDVQVHRPRDAIERGIEAPRVSRRLQLVRRSIRYEQDNQQIFT